MIFLSRVFYLSKLEIFRALIQLDGDPDLDRSKSTRDFFYVGFPRSAPEVPPGTIGVLLGEDFLKRNMRMVSWGFFGDSGSILAGFRTGLDPALACTARLKSETILEMMEAIKALPYDRQLRLLNGEPDVPFLHSIKHLLDRCIVRATEHSTSNGDWRIEVAMKFGYTLELCDIIAIALPNTYRDLPYLKEVVRSLPEHRVTYFNPRKDTPHSCLKMVKF